jgi:hypothetical protein
MEAEVLVLAMVNALAASTLLTAGLAKHVSPTPVRRALREAVPVLETRALSALSRGFATTEIVVGVALSIHSLRIPAAIAAASLGTCFVALGLRGQFGRSTAPCGCFGSSSQRPLGWSNVAVGVALIGAGPVNLAVTPGEQHPAVAILLTAIGSIVLCGYVNRTLILRLLRPAPHAST